MSKSVMPFEKFKYVMEQIKAHSDKIERISDFFEKELCTDSWCLFTVGDELAQSLCCMLADEFNCWYDTSSNKEKIDEVLQQVGLPPTEESTVEWWTGKRCAENDIEYWLYEESKKIVVDGKEIYISTLEEFYHYLITYYVDKKEN